MVLHPGGFSFQGGGFSIWGGFSIQGGSPSGGFSIRGASPSRGGFHPGGGSPSGQCAGGTHPTGMYSCYLMKLLILINLVKAS